VVVQHGCLVILSVIASPFFSSSPTQNYPFPSGDAYDSVLFYILAKLQINQMPDYKKDKVISREEAYFKACNYCAYQERLQEEVRQKLLGFKLAPEVVEDIVSALITNNFLNEERYAKAYAGGKFRVKKWGRLKIIRNLEMKGVSAYCVKIGLAEIEEDEYRKALKELLYVKKSRSDAKNSYVLKHQLSLYAIGKGFEPDLVWEMLVNME
jgi:regulatory protein